MRSAAPYQPGTCTVCQGVVVAVRISASVGRRTFPARASERARQPHRCRLVERCIQAQARDCRDAGVAHGIEEQKSGKATVGDQDEVAFGEPAAGLQGHLPTPVEERLVATTWLAEPLGRRQRRQDWQGPDAPDPNGREQHKAHPAQAACLDEVGVQTSDGSR